MMIFERRAGAAPAAFPVRAQPHVASVVAAVLGIGALHAALTWGYTTIWYGDVGAWLAQAERVAQGEALYRDVSSSLPPLGTWVLAFWGRIAGTDAVPLMAGGLMIYFGILIVFAAFCATVLPRRLAGLVAAAALIFALGQAQAHAAPLPVGSYHPGVPLGFLLMCGALLVRLRWPGRHSVLLGVVAGLAVLTKHDYWLPSMAIVAWEMWDARRTPQRALAAPLAATAVICAGLFAVGITAGWSLIVPMLTGFGVAGEQGIVSNLPTWHRLVVELASLAATIAVVALVLSISGVRLWRTLALALGAFALLAAVYVTAAVVVAEGIRANGPAAWPNGFALRLEWEATNDRPVVKLALKMLHSDILLAHFPPLLLPLALLILVAYRWKSLDARRGVLLGLLFVAVALRARRGFELADWYHILIEIPVYALALDVFVPHVRRRAVMSFAAGLLAVAGYAYWSHGTGLLTQEGVPTTVSTARGTVRWTAGQVPAYHELLTLFDRLDPDRTTPVFNLGHNGGLAYWTRRENPVPVFTGLHRSALPADSVITLLQRTRPLFMVYPHMYEVQGEPQSGFRLRTWSPPHQANHYMTRDKPHFERLAAECELIPTAIAFTVYHCIR